ncbi:MAG TPA: DUF58 domain-containing protein [Vicinamibacteria bacterium]|nr:DUF58 domain-containing protein [Vicinamibacteria bacterium]
MLHRGSRLRTFAFGGLPWVLALALLLRADALWGVAFGWGLLLLAAHLASRRALAGLSLRREVYPNAFEGDTVVVDLVLENRSPRRALLVELGDAFGPGHADRQSLLEPGPLPGRCRRRLRYRTACSRDWGVYTLGPLTLSGADPAGLFRVSVPLGGISSFAVFPRVHEVLGIERIGARPTFAPRETTVARPGQSSAYMGVRDWRPEDGLRRIHWPATARLGSLAVKEVEVDLEPQFALFLDLERGHRAGTGRKSALEYVVRTAASLLWTATQRGQSVEVHGAAKHAVLVPAGRGEAHLAHALDELIRVGMDGTEDVLELVERQRPALAFGSTAAILFATIRVDVRRVEACVQGLRERGVHPLLVFVNGDSFAPVDKWPLPRERMLEAQEQLRALLRDHGVPGAILGVEDDLAAELPRADLFAGPS